MYTDRQQNLPAEPSISNYTSSQLFSLQTKSNKGAGHTHLEQYSQKQVAKRALKLLPSLCDHLEATSAYFQALIEQNDGLMDGPGSNTEEAQLMGRCLELLLQAMCSLFSWLVLAKMLCLKSTSDFKSTLH